MSSILCSHARSDNNNFKHAATCSVNGSKILRQSSLFSAGNIHIILYYGCNKVDYVDWNHSLLGQYYGQPVTLPSGA